MQAAIYLRISSDPTGEQLGVTRQREDCARLCTDKGWTAVEYIDNDVSASSLKRRPAYERMLADIRAGRISAVVAWDLDRLHRRPVELEAFMALADDKQLALATVSGDVDLSTPQGRLVARLKGAVARHEVEHKVARQRRAAQQKAERGLPQWTRAFGYLGDTRQPDPETAPLVAEAYRTVLAGGSITDVTRAWNAAGVLTIKGKPWTPAQLSSFLRKPRNAGLRAHNDQIVGAGTWPALIDEETWRAVRAKLDARNRGRRAIRCHTMTGILQCGKPGCGGYLSGHRTIDKRIAYACKTCRGVSVRADQVEPMVFKLLAGRLAQADAVDLLRAELHDTELAEQLRGERATLLARLDEIADAVADGDLTPPQARRATERVNEKLAAIDGRQQDQERLRVFDGLPLGRPEVAETIEKLSPDRLRAVLAVVATITVTPCGKGGYLVDPVTKEKLVDPDRLQVTWL
ncbi:serine recombinase [Mycobacterium vulneris]|uniref:Serine recombinase n=1 Tax=Mycolicibacterium vulneris TaxID=547163 RepID=A0A1X2KK10_9MYCO|nr:recombinase family protein [Mycolicibacterium vulneris]OSC22104.1 serine recombinase [Mycolicibacterium vulneris]